MPTGEPRLPCGDAGIWQACELMSPIHHVWTLEHSKHVNGRAQTMCGRWGAEAGAGIQQVFEHLNPSHTQRSVV